MSYLNSNIKHLRKLKGYTQASLAEKIGLKRSLVGAYEEGRAEPKITTIQKLSALFQTSIDALIDMDLSRGMNKLADLTGKALRVLPIVITPEEQERISVVPVKAEAGYAASFADPEYVGSLPQFSLPLDELYPDQTTRLFQISGDSMLPIQSGSYIIASYVEDWYSIKSGQCYIIVTRDEGVVYKRITNQLDRDVIILNSDNPVYKPYELKPQDIAEVWASVGFISFELPKKGEVGKLGELRDMMAGLSEQLTEVSTMMGVVE
jgi:transcriptional regulator with XRE-family HTH domain